MASLNDNTGRDPNHCPFLNRRKGLSMASLNVNSLLAKIDEVRLLAKNKCIDILAVNETKLIVKLMISLLP